MSDLQPFENRLAETWHPSDWTSVPVVIAVSGGADSVALLRALAALRASRREPPPQSLVVAHLNHGLRGISGDEDARFVARLADQLGLPCEFGSADVRATAEAEKDGIEAAARSERYAFLEQVAARHSARYVATAHTANDQVETVLQRVIRGTGLRGLAGMSRVRSLNASVTLIRPLLAFQREELVAYLSALEQPFCHDATNDQREFTRNRIRHELLPQLREGYNPRVDDSLQRLAALAGENQAYIDTQVARLRERVPVESDERKISFDCRVLNSAPPLLVRELLHVEWREHEWPLQTMRYDHWFALAELAQSGEARVLNLPCDIRAEKKDGQLSLTRP